MENEKIKNHVKISVAVLAIGYFLASYIFGSFNHNSATSDDRVFTVILIVLAALVSNFIYYENYTEKNKTDIDDEEVF
jgi:hypothetical protein